MSKQKTFFTSLRQKHDFTQEQVADVIGVTRQTYAVIESGKQELSLSQAKKLADLYGISLEDIVTQKDTSLKIKIKTIEDRT